VTHPSYISFVENVVLPGRSRNPAHLRLDGQTTGGNRTVAGTFRGDGREWRVHEDSHYEPLLAAYESFKAGDPWPFIEEPTKTGSCLDLKPELQARLSDRRHKYLYIYSI
jgi:hypothetical protein